LLNRMAMDALAGSYPGSLVSLEESLDREFERLLSDCPTLAFRVALGVLRNRTEAEDVAQEALLRAYRNFHRLRDRDRFRGWLARAAWRLSLDRLRASGRRERRERTAADPAWTNMPPSTTAEGLGVSSEFQRHLEQAMDELPEKLRIVMVLAAIEGYDTREVAGLLELPEGTVKSRLHLARKRLAERLR
jgi:RNA polymerase sigma-70 factor (ECF subfamily)